MSSDFLTNLKTCGADHVLGRQLAALVKNDAPRLPSSSRGLMLPLLATTQDGPLSTHFASGFTIPLKWSHEHKDDTSRLPANLLDLGREVHQVTCQTFRIQGPWGLRLWDAYDTDLRALDGLLEWESAWTTLAAGLIVASIGGTPNRNIFSSACWDRTNAEVRGVTGIDAKIDAIRRMIGDQEATLYVSAVNAQEAIDHLREHHRDARITIKTYPVRALTNDRAWLQRVLREHLDDLAVPPSEDAEQLITWMNNNALSERARERGYLQVVERLAETLRQRLAEQLQGLDTLLTCANPFHHHQASLLTLALKPRRVIIASQGRSKTIAEAFQQWAHTHASTVKVVHISLSEQGDEQVNRSTFMGQIEQELRSRTREGVALDSTSGTRELMWAIEAACERAQVPGERIYISTTREDHGVIYGSERLLLYNELAKSP